MIGATNKTKLSYVKEVTPGTTPATPAFQLLRILGESLNANITTLQSEEITVSRDVPDLILSDSSVGGGFTAEMSYSSFDDMIAGALFADAAWTTDTITASTIAATATGFTDSGNGLVAAGFDVGQFVKVAGFGTTSINKYYRILTVAAGEITTYPAPPTTDAAGDSVTISGSTIKSGSTDHSFTLQKQFTDLAVPVYHYFRGCRVASMNMNVAAGEKVGIDFDFLGMSSDPTVTPFTGQTEVAKTTTRIMNAVTNALDLIAVSDTMTTSVKFTDLSLAYNNALRELKAVGTFGAIDVRPGTIDGMATINPYFEDMQMLTAFLANTSFSLSWRLTDAAGNSYIFSMPSVKFTTQSLNAGSRDADMIINGQCKAILDTSSNCSMRVDKFAA